MKRILLSMAYEQTITIGMYRITRIDIDDFMVNGESLDLEFSLYAVGA